jgi:hypothetical protein
MDTSMSDNTAGVLVMAMICASFCWLIYWGFRE